MIAPSLSISASSAPLAPAVTLARCGRSTSSASGLPLACTPRIARRPSSDGDADVDVTREAAGAQQRRVQRVQAVGRGDDEQPLVAAEAVHLDEQLVEGLVGLAVALAAVRAAAALGADGVDLVDEDDRGGARAGLGEQVAHAAGADADVHLDEVRAGHRRRTRRPPRPRRPWRAASCRCREARGASGRWASSRRARR